MKIMLKSLKPGSDGHTRLPRRKAPRQLKGHKQYYDHKFCCMALAPGDIVLVRTKAFAQVHKIADKWEQNPHIVLSQVDNQPVFKVQTKNARDQEGIQILYQNMLYPIQSAQDNAQDTMDQSPMKSVMALAKANLLMDPHFGDV